MRHKFSWNPGRNNRNRRLRIFQQCLDIRSTAGYTFENWKLCICKWFCLRWTNGKPLCLCSWQCHRNRSRRFQRLLSSGYKIAESGKALRTVCFFKKQFIFCNISGGSRKSDNACDYGKWETQSALSSQKFKGTVSALHCKRWLWGASHNGFPVWGRFLLVFWFGYGKRYLFCRHRSGMECSDQRLEFFRVQHRSVGYG